MKELKDEDDDSSSDEGSSPITEKMFQFEE
jgi:hypothetical protein